MPTFDELREPWKKKGQEQRFDNKVNELVQVICRQTDYNEDVAKAKLVEHALDLHAVVREYLGVGERKSESKKTSTNQMVFKEFRTFLDDAASSYYKRKESEQIRNNILEAQKNAVQARRSSEVNKTMNSIKED